MKLWRLRNDDILRDEDKRGEDGKTQHYLTPAGCYNRYNAGSTEVFCAPGCYKKCYKTLRWVLQNGEALSR